MRHAVSTQLSCQTIPPRPTRLLSPKILFLTLGAAGVGLALSWLLFGWTEQDSFLRKVDDLLFQLVGLGVLGVLLSNKIKQYIDRVDDQRTQRIDLLQRMRKAHVTVAYARWLICADDAVETYLEQMMKIALVPYDLDEVKHDLSAASKLFEPYDKDILDGINELITYLECGVEEYKELIVRFRKQTRPTFNPSLHQTLREASATVNASWTLEFTNHGRPVQSGDKLPDKYDCALSKSKGSMRRYIYGSGDG